MSLPPLSGRLIPLYRTAWCLLLILALGAVETSWINPSTSLEILGLRLAKSAVLITVSAIFFRRRGHDPVAAMLSLAFLLWTASSSIDLTIPALWPALLDRLRFLLFAVALLLFPDGHWQPGWTRSIAAAIFLTFLIGIAEASGGLSSHLYLPIAIGCVLAALAALFARYRALEAGTQKQQLKWVTLGLFVGVSLILAARAGAALTSRMAAPAVSGLVIEGLFQLGIIVLALGFLISLLRYRLYDAEAAISRSAALAALTLAVVAIFAGMEALIEMVGQNYFGSGIGNLSGAMAAAVAAVMLAPLHGRISDWAEHHFQRDLTILKRQLPDLLQALSTGASVKQMAAAVMPRIEHAIQSTRMVLLVDGKLVAAQGIKIASARNLLKGWIPPDATRKISRNDDDPFPLRLALSCPFGSVRGWLLIGPRPDGSFFGKEDLEALVTVAPPIQRALFEVAQREAENRRRRQYEQHIESAIQSIHARLDQLELRAETPTA